VNPQPAEGDEESGLYLEDRATLSAAIGCLNGFAMATCFWALVAVLVRWLA
jgi:hypothetical protein